MTTLTQKPATKGQVRQIEGLAGDAVSKVLEDLGLTKESAQRVHARGGEFAEAIRIACQTALTDLSSTNKYADEEVTSKYGYLSGYAPKPLAEQVTRLKELYPQLKDAEVPEQDDVPTGTEGWFAIPNVWKEDSLLTGSYNDSVVQMLERIKKDRDDNFYNYRDGQLGTDRLRQSARSEAAWKKISADQGHPDILVIAAQFGLQHRGRSVRRAREVMVDQNQFGLGAFAVGMMILTHPDRLKHYDDLWIDCAGDEFDDPDADVRFDHAPCFEFYDGGVKFGTGWADGAVDDYGSASGVLPQ